jgi:hypothetical protein
MNDNAFPLVALYLAFLRLGLGSGKWGINRLVWI